MSDVIFSTSDIVFSMSDVVFGVSGKSCLFRFCGNYMNGVCCLLIAYGIYVGAYCIRPVCRRINRTANHHYIANPRNSGRMQYAPTAAQIVEKQKTVRSGIKAGTHRK